MEGPSYKLLLLLSIALLLSASPAQPRPSSSITNTISDDLPGSQVVCTPTRWYDIVWFYFANYLLHALSVRSLPGENLFSIIVFKLSCLLIPYTGLRRGLCLIARAGNLTKNDFQAATRANALCMVVRGPDWKPENGDEIQGCIVDKVEGSLQLLSEEAEKRNRGGATTGDTIEIERVSPDSTTERVGDGTGTVSFKTTDFYAPPSPSSFLDKIYRKFVQTYKFGNHTPSQGCRLNPDHVKVHGLCRLPPGYGLSYVPEDVKVFPRYASEDRPDIVSAILTREFSALATVFSSETKLATAHNTPRILFSLMQTISGGYSLYRAQGSQIDRYGFAAFGLTVLPYMIISIFNFVGSLLTSEYEMVYMVHSPIMEEMIRRGGATDGVVGTLEGSEETDAMITVAQERILPTGMSLQFQGSNENICYRQINRSSSYSDVYAIKPLPTPRPATMDAIIHQQRWWKRFCHWYKVKTKCLVTPDVPPNTTIISVPCHSSLTRLPKPFYESFLHVLTIVLLMAAVIVPWMTIYLLSGFRKAHSTSTQRNFALNWLIYGQIMGYAVGAVEKLSGRRDVLKGFLFIFVSYGCYCLSGFVIVAQEMLEFGKCTAV